jgi:hypothetical protein
MAARTPAGFLKDETGSIEALSYRARPLKRSCGKGTLVLQVRKIPSWGPMHEIVWRLPYQLC